MDCQLLKKKILKRYDAFIDRAGGSAGEIFDSRSWRTDWAQCVTESQIFSRPTRPNSVNRYLINWPLFYFLLLFSMPFTSRGAFLKAVRLFTARLRHRIRSSQENFFNLLRQKRAWSQGSCGKRKLSLIFPVVNFDLTLTQHQNEYLESTTTCSVQFIEFDV